MLFLVLLFVLGSFVCAQEGESSRAGGPAGSAGTSEAAATAGTAETAESAEAAETAETAEAAEGGESGRSPLATGLIALAAALAIGITAVGTGIAQSRIGAAGAGTIAERPESAGTIIILLAIPETIVILGFIVSVVMMFTL
jgi:V/A-type H+-transporting ATPase subunit K